jgi:uncharacterized phage protein (TIGR01671 family)
VKCTKKAIAKGANITDLMRKRWSLMRDIRFRGKRLDNGEWVYGSLVCEGKQTFIVGYFAISDYLPKEDLMFCKCVAHEVDHQTVGQFTGLCDKSGKEIYEGDTVLYNDVKRIIYYNEVSAAFVTTRYDDRLWPIRLSDIVKNSEIIGNIHDKELTSND